MSRVRPFAVALVIALCATIDSEAGFWPIDAPLPVLDKLIEQGGVFRGRSVTHAQDTSEFRITRTDETAGGLPYYVYRVSLVIRREDGSERRSLHAELYTVRDLDWSDTEITMHIRHPAHSPETRWRLTLDTEGRPLRVWAQRVRFLGWLPGRPLEGVFGDPRVARFGELHSRR